MKLPLYPTHPARPERVCWGCDEYCPADNLSCGKDTLRTPHPVELFGEDWQPWAETGSETVAASSRVVDTLRCAVDPK